MLTSMRELPMTIVEVISSAGKAVAAASETIRYRENRRAEIPGESRAAPN